MVIALFAPPTIDDGDDVVPVDVVALIAAIAADVVDADDDAVDAGFSYVVVAFDAFMTYI